MQRQTAPDSQSSLVELKVDITGPPLERDVYTAQVMAQVATGEVGEEKDVCRIPLRPWEVEVIANPSLLEGMM